MPTGALGPAIVAASVPVVSSDVPGDASGPGCEWAPLLPSPGPGSPVPPCMGEAGLESGGGDGATAWALRPGDVVAACVVAEGSTGLQSPPVCSQPTQFLPGA